VHVIITTACTTIASHAVARSWRVVMLQQGVHEALQAGQNTLLLLLLLLCLRLRGLLQGWQRWQ
jgi:hypothetical protein